MKVTFDVLHHHDGVVHHQTDRQHNRQQRQQVDSEARHQHQKHSADQRDRNRDHRNQHGPERPEEQENHNDNDQQRFRKSAQHLSDRILDVRRRIVRNANLHADRQLRTDSRNGIANILDYFKGVCSRQNPNAHECSRFPVETNVFVVGLSAEHNIGDLAQTNDRALVLLYHQLTKLLSSPQIGVRHQVHGNHRTLCAPQSREVVVVG